MHSLWVGSRGIYRALDKPNCKAYFPHTFGLIFPDFFFGGLTIVSLVIGVPRPGKGLPCPFSLVRFLCSCSVSVKSSVFQIRLGFLETVRLRFFCAFFGWTSLPVFVIIVVVVFIAVSRSVAPNSIYLLHFFTSLR